LVMAGARALQRVAMGLFGGASVLACALDRLELARLSDALRGGAELTIAPSFAELRESLRSSTREVNAIVLPARDASGESARRTIRDIAAERPRAAIVVYCQPGWQYDTDLRSLAAAGAHQFIFGGSNDTPADFRAVIKSAQSQCAAECVLQLLESCVPGPLHPVFEAAVSRPQQITDVLSLAAALGVHRKTLFNMCTRHHFVPPAELLAWARLVLVGYLLETTGCTIETIANELSYPSPTALRNAMKRYTGYTASDIRANGGSSAVIAALERRLRHAADRSALHVV